MALRAMYPDLTHAQIAEKMGYAASGLTDLLYRANKQGLLKFEEPLNKLRYEIIPMVADNLADFMKSPDDKTRLIATMGTAKETLFKQFQASEGIQESTNMVLALKIEPATPRELTGEIVGVGREIEGEFPTVIEVAPLPLAPAPISPDHPDMAAAVEDLISTFRSS